MIIRYLTDHIYHKWNYFSQVNKWSIYYIDFLKEKLSKITIYFLVVLKKFYYVLPSFTKKKKLNLDQALQTGNRDPSKKCTDSNTQKQTLCFRNLQIFLLFTFRYLQRSASARSLETTGVITLGWRF